ncbi:MAG: L,D-transpeptidase [Acidimicrobiales bacterium]
MGSRGQRLVGGGIAALMVVAAIVFVVTRPDDTPRAAAAVTTTSTTTTSTTTTAPLPPLPVDPIHTQVAQAVLPTTHVYAQPPAGAVLDPRVTAAGATLATMVPSTSPERAGAPALPTIEHPIQGRRATPDGWDFDNPTPWGNRLTFMITENHGDWLRVEVPVRPNGTTGWIRAADVDRSTIDTHVEIDVSDRTLKAWSGTNLIVETKVVVGKDSTPTPRGRLYLTDFEEKYRGSAYGPWVLPLSGYSQALDEFSGGVPVIAMHGTNRPELIGTAASNGCIRMPDDVIQRLHDTLFFGTPVDIRD